MKDYIPATVFIVCVFLAMLLGAGEPSLRQMAVAWIDAKIATERALLKGDK